MKIHPSLRTVHAEQERINAHLKNRVETTLLRLKDPKWHFEGRLKQEESFAVKVEAGLVGDPRALEDFLACVLVVPSFAEVAKAEEKVAASFTVVQRRPESADSTAKLSSSFPFDDVRLYLRYPEDDTVPKQVSDDVVFELQIRTFLQHAWSVSTHDVVYKTDSVSWARERVAHQIKAMLEHAELAVSNLGSLDTAASLSVAYEPYDKINDVIELLRLEWPGAQLPTDLKRLATGIVVVVEGVAGMSIDHVKELLAKGRARYGGQHNTDWSPHRAVLEYLVDDEPDRLREFLMKDEGARPIYVYEEILERLGIAEADVRNAVWI